mmetsp:Transcript_26860/g.70614  ORF Transcript_26860/g.70614 Transcript_26860/m.70614 type:complete len:258 (-) Transcript_26860:660-1433(-)
MQGDLTPMRHFDRAWRASRQRCRFAMHGLGGKGSSRALCIGCSSSDCWHALRLTLGGVEGCTQGEPGGADAAVALQVRGGSAQDDVKAVDEGGAEGGLQAVYLGIGQRALHTAVAHAVAATAASRLGVVKGALQHQALGEVARHVAQHLVHIVLVQVVGLPEGNILVAHREPAQCLELNPRPRPLLDALELAKKSGVAGPEEADVGHIEEHHGQPLQPHSKRPPAVRGQSSILQDALPHHSTSKNFHPCFVEPDLKL